MKELELSEFQKTKFNQLIDCYHSFSKAKDERSKAEIESFIVGHKHDLMRSMKFRDYMELIKLTQFFLPY